MSTRNEIVTFVLTVFVLFFVMGTLVSMASPNLQPQVIQTRNTVDKLNLKIINQALQRYYLEQGAYPEQLSQLVPEYLDEVPKVQQQGKEISYKNKDTSYKLAIK